MTKWCKQDHLGKTKTKIGDLKSKMKNKTIGVKNKNKTLVENYDLSRQLKVEPNRSIQDRLNNSK